MTFSAPFPRPLVPGFGPGTSSASVPWYLAGGVAPSACVAAYQPKGAASLSASYTNLVSPGSNDAAPGVAPTFAAATGWTFNGSSQYLTTSSTPTVAWSAIVCYSGVGTNLGAKFLLGCGDNAGFSIQPKRTSDRPYYVNSGILTGDNHTGSTGVLCVAGKNGYYNGAAETGTMSTVASVYTTIWIGAGHVVWSGQPQYLLACNILALAIYNNTLTAPQVLAISTAMAAL